MIALPAGASAVRAGQEIVLYKFIGINGDGNSPEASLVRDSQGNLYGTAQYGGQFDYGTVFMLTSDGAFTVLHNFTGGADGANPLVGVTLDSEGNLYGTAYQGGTPGCFHGGGCGTVFKITP